MSQIWLRRKQIISKWLLNYVIKDIENKKLPSDMQLTRKVDLRPYQAGSFQLTELI